MLGSEAHAVNAVLYDCLTLMTKWPSMAEATSHQQRVA